MTPIGVQFVPLAKFDQTETLLSLLRGGQLLRGRVVSGESQPALLVAGQRIPLPAALAATPGETLSVRLVEQDGKQTLLVRPGTSPAPDAGAVPRDVLSPVLRHVLDTIGASIRNEQAAHLAPKTVPLRQSDLEAIVRLFVQQGRSGEALGRLVAVLEEAVASGALPRAAADQFRHLARQMRAQTADEFVALVRAARESAGRPLENRLALLAARHDGATVAGVRDTLLGELLRLRQDSAVREALEQMGRWTVFKKTAEDLIGRLQSAHLQNLRSLELPYQFMELPLARENGIDHAQLHIVGDEGGGIAGKRRRAHSIVLDLQLSRLGAVWIALHTADSRCQCTIRAQDRKGEEVLAGETGRLQAGLARAGFASVDVRTEPWDGDRLLAVAQLMGRFAGFEART